MLMVIHSFIVSWQPNGWIIYSTIYTMGNVYAGHVMLGSSNLLFDGFVCEIVL
jgi:hypothetical protein